MSESLLLSRLRRGDGSFCAGGVGRVLVRGLLALRSIAVVERSSSTGTAACTPEGLGAELSAITEAARAGTRGTSRFGGECDGFWTGAGSGTMLSGETLPHKRFAI